jgi:CDP-diacylglycerol--serine O-phosphatidyltransferase
LPLIIRFDQFHLGSLITNPYLIILLSVVLSVLMVLELPLFNLKFSNFTWNDNRIRFVFLLLSVPLLLLLKFAAIPAIVCMYIVLSVVQYYVLNKAAA